LTAYADEDTLQRAKVTEPFGYIVKPFDERDLHAAIEVALRRRVAEAAIRVALEKERELSELKIQVLVDGHP
jgi:AmiR/NasT family two-component response regulator